MILRLNVDEMSRRAGRCGVFRTAGRLHSVRGLLRADLRAAVGELCEIRDGSGTTRLGEVVGFDSGEAQLMCFDPVRGLTPDTEVVATGRKRRVPVGTELLGRVLDGIGRPLDQKPLPGGVRYRQETHSSPSPLTRQRIRRPLATGQRVIDGFVSVGLGQRIGLFAGSGVGKSTLMGSIASHAAADVNVIALVGERGRELVPFLEDSLGPEGLARSVVVIATSDESPLMRIKAVLTAVTIAEAFRDEGRHVLFFLDSLTRLAFAQRELGLLLGEPPGVRGYPPSVQTILAEVLERLGCSDRGSITGLITVLVEGDDHDEPIADAARSILDGHLVLSRKLAEQGHFPAVDVLASVSRVFREITTAEHQQAAARVRDLMATWHEMEDLIQIGAYQKGSSQKLDRAIQLMPAVRRLLRQANGDVTSWEETVNQLNVLAQAWPFAEG